MGATCKRTRRCKRCVLSAGNIRTCLSLQLLPEPHLWWISRQAAVGPAYAPTPPQLSLSRSPQLSLSRSYRLKVTHYERRSASQPFAEDDTQLQSAWFRSSACVASYQACGCRQRWRMGTLLTASLPRWEVLSY
jgi:hypothetical protein